jgi:hypothetical protein
MAERFQRYRRRPLQLPDLPTVDYISAGRAQAQATQSIANALNRIGDFVYRQQAEEAYERGVENAPTAEQIADAAKTGAELDIPTNKYAQAGALVAVTNRMQVKVLEELVVFDNDEATALLTPQEYSLKANAIINGYASVLDESVGKAVGEKFRAKMFTIGNQRLTAHAKRQFERVEQQNRSNDYASANAIIGMMPEVIDAGGMISPIDGNVTSPVDVARSMIESIRESAHITATEADGLVAKANDALMDAVKANVSQWVSQKPEAHIAQMLTNKVEDPSIKLLLGELDSVERMAVVMGAAEANEANEAVQKGLSDARKRKRQEQTDRVSALATQAYMNGDQEEMAKQLNLLEEVDLASYNKLNAAFLKEGGQDNPATMQELEVLAASKVITLQDVLDRRDQMSTQTFKDYVGKVNARRKEDHNIAVDMFRAHFGVPKNAFMPNPGKAGQIAEAESELNLAAKADPTLNRIQFARDYIAKLQPDVEKTRREAREQLDAAKEVNGYADKSDEDYMSWVMTQKDKKGSQWYNLQTGYLKTLGLMND